HYAVAETITWYLDIVARYQQPGLNHVFDRNAEAAEMLLESEALARSVADAESDLGCGIKAAISQIAPRPRASPRRQGRFEEFGRKRNHVVKRAPTALLGFRLARHCRHRKTSERGQSFHRFREGDAFRFHREGKNVAVLSG